MVQLIKKLSEMLNMIQPPPDDPTPEEAVSVLVVEDDPTRQDDFIRPILAAGAKVELVATMRQALITINDRRYDILLLDGNIYNAGGKVILEAWLNKSGGPSAIFATETGSDLINDVLREGVSTVIPRPFDPEAFARTVGRFIRYARREKQIDVLIKNQRINQLEMYKIRRAQNILLWIIFLLIVPAMLGFPAIESFIGALF